MTHLIGMGRYSKVNSNYVLKKKHLDTSKGTIYERDWVTLGETRILEPGKRPIYFDGHFLFTDNSRITTRKRHRFGTEVASWTYDEVSDASPKSNEVAVNLRSDDMRYARRHTHSSWLMEATRGNTPL